MDLGSELGRNVEVKKLLTKHGYDIQPISLDASHQNLPGERPHETIGDAVRTMLEESELVEKNGVMHYITTLRFHSYLPHHVKDKTPHGIDTGN
eukprot:14078488-Ditylum_brightwellii.AAC.2